MHDGTAAQAFAFHHSLTRSITPPSLPELLLLNLRPTLDDPAAATFLSPLSSPPVLADDLRRAAAVRLLATLPPSSREVDVVAVVL